MTDYLRALDPNDYEHDDDARGAIEGDVDWIECPWCQAEMEDLWDVLGDDEAYVECLDCHQPVHLRRPPTVYARKAQRKANAPGRDER